MQTKVIPSCYFPTTVVLLDDNRHFLDSVNVLLLNNRLVTPRLFDNPIECLEFLNNEYQPDSFLRRCLTRPEEEDREHRIIDLNVRSIHKEIYNARRFNETSLIIIDYTMPGLNGLEICQKINYPFIKKILLTGEADERLAVSAFNEGLIHKFIRKNANHFEELLQEAVSELQLQYFQDLSEIITTSLTKDITRPAACLDDPVFVNFFMQLCKDNHIIEYYLLDSQGSFLLSDTNGQISWLIVKNDEEMHASHETARYADTKVPSSILEGINSRNCILYLHTDEDYQKDPSEWEKYLHPAHRLDGRRETYYYAHIKNPRSYYLDQARICSYLDYLDR